MRAPSRGSRRAVYAPVALSRRSIRYCSRSSGDDVALGGRERGLAARAFESFNANSLAGWGLTLLRDSCERMV